MQGGTSANGHYQNDDADPDSFKKAVPVHANMAFVRLSAAHERTTRQKHLSIQLKLWQKEICVYCDELPS